MNNSEVIQHQGKDVLVMDLSNVAPVDVIKRIKAIEEKIAGFPLGSVYLLLLSTNLAYNKIISSNLNAFSGVYGKYIKASVVVDETMDSNAPLSSKDDLPKKSKVFSNTTEALDWLVAQ